MANNARAIPRYAQASPFDWLYRTHQSVTVRVMDGKREVDALRASTPSLLRASLQPIYRHMRPDSRAIQFFGVEERCLPGGFRRTRREFRMPNIKTALALLSEGCGR